MVVLTAISIVIVLRFGSGVVKCSCFGAGDTFSNRSVARNSGILIIALAGFVLLVVGSDQQSEVSSAAAAPLGIFATVFLKLISELRASRRSSAEQIAYQTAILELDRAWPARIDRIFVS